MRKENNNSSYTVWGWMRNILGLKGSELIVYAVIYQYTQAGEQKYIRGYSGLIEETGLSLAGVRNAVNALVDKGYIIKEIVEINNVVFNHYSVDTSYIKGAENGKKQD